MQKITGTTELIQYQQDELPVEYQKLVREAAQALNGSYAPYSHFPVGAALLLHDGTIVKGANQENAAYPSGLCAERTALFYAGANYTDTIIKALAVTVKNSIDSFPFPCGSCLQVMSEYQEKQQASIDILMIHPQSGEVLLSRGIQNLLPFAFKKSHLIK